ncbi:MAG: hypothetical protein ACON5B_11340 [Myxococcota bacterium]
MNPQFVQRLRVVLMSTDDVWRTQFQSALDAFARDTEALEQTRQFLEEHVKGAELAYRARMEEMMGLVDGRLAKQSGRTDEHLLSLVDELREAQADLEVMNRRLAGLRGRIRDALHPGEVRVVGGYRFTLEVAQPIVHVTDESLLEDDMGRWSPDHEKIGQHWTRTGRAPDGTLVRAGQPRLKVEDAGSSA